MATIPVKFIENWTDSDWTNNVGYTIYPVSGKNSTGQPTDAPTGYVRGNNASFIARAAVKEGTFDAKNNISVSGSQRIVFAEPMFLTNFFYSKGDYNPYKKTLTSAGAKQVVSKTIKIGTGVYKKSRFTGIVYMIVPDVESMFESGWQMGTTVVYGSSSSGQATTPDGLQINGNYAYPSCGISPDYNPNLVQMYDDNTRQLVKITPEYITTLSNGSKVYKLTDYDRTTGFNKRFLFQGFFQFTGAYNSPTDQAEWKLNSGHISNPAYGYAGGFETKTALVNTMFKSYTTAQLNSANNYSGNLDYISFTANPDVTLHFPSALMNYTYGTPHFADKSWFEIVADSPCIRFSSSDKQFNGMTIQRQSQIYTSDLDSYTAYFAPSFATADGYPYIKLESFYTSLEKLMPADVWNYNMNVKMTLVPETNRTQFTAVTLPNGSVLYDAEEPFDVSYAFMAKASTTNLPGLPVSIATRYRNHNAKYAVLANDFDYFDYSWRGTVDSYQRDPTVTLTLRYGDQIVATKTMDGTAGTSQTFQHGPFLIAPTTQGQLVQITGIVTDRRGRKSAEKTFTITDNNSQDTLEYLRFYNYSYPTVMVQGYRCLQNGTPDPDNGTYIKLTATYVFSPVDYGLTTYSEGTVDGQLKIKLVPHSGTLSQSDYSYTITTASGNKDIMLAVGLDQSVDIQVQVTDFIGNTFKASTEFIPSARVVLDFRREGSALSIGKRNEFDNALEVAWDTTFYGNVTIKGNVNITGQKQTATTADAVSYNDTKNIGARTVQAALDTLASRAGVSTTQVQAIVNQAITNLDVPTDQHINDLIITKINNIAFPPSISEARALELIENELANFSAGIDETAVNALIDAKTQDFIKADALNPYATKAELTNGYYTKQQVDDKIAAVGVDEEAVQQIVDDALAAQPALTAENVSYGDSNVKEALDSMGTIVEELPDAVDEVGQKVDDQTGKVDLIITLLGNINQTEWQDGNGMYF